MDVPNGAQEEIPWKKYDTYPVKVDPAQDDRATTLNPCPCCARPHMRAWFCSWWAHFVSYFVWFAIAPLLGDMRGSLNLTKQEIWNSSVAGVWATILSRVVLGPLCDLVGARNLLLPVLVFTSMTCALTGVVFNAASLIVLRIFLGFAGGIFVICLYWTSCMFAKCIIGTTAALVAGWGKIGGGVTQTLLGSLLLPAFKLGMSSEVAWRTVSVIPALIALFSAVIIYFISDDSPRGNYCELRRHRNFKMPTIDRYLIGGLVNPSIWVLLIQFACCNGSELTMNNAAALFFRDWFGLSTEQAVRYPSDLGYMNCLSPLLGGILSDVANKFLGLRGRILCQTVFLSASGALILVFPRINWLPSAQIVLFFYMLFAQAAQASTFAIAPYVYVPATGLVMGIVAAGGNLGAFCFGMMFRELNYLVAFDIMGGIVLASSVLSALIYVKGHSALFCGSEAPNDAVASDVGAAVPAGPTTATVIGGQDDKREIEVET